MGIVQVQVSSDVSTYTTLIQLHTILLRLPQIWSRGDTLVRCKRDHVPTGDGGTSLVHRRMLPGARIRGDDLGIGGSNGRDTKGGRDYRQGNFNVDMEGTEGRGQDGEIAAEISTAGLGDILGHFLS